MRTLTFNRIIGVGAMGTVYHAELRVPRGFARQCAVKVMKSTSPDQEHFRARMRDEARLLGMLQDEQILGVSELVRVDGRDCVVMEYVEGVDLADLIREHTVPSRALAELGAEVAGTMHRAHAATHPHTGDPLRVIHRDVKPANCMITSRGGVRLLDFGVARAAFSSRESQTQGLVLGTLNYFPPEILAGGEPTPAVDIYGLGLTLWECATGKDWGSPQVHKHRFERRVEQRLSEVSPEYQPIVPVLRQVLQWNPEARPTGAQVEKLLLAAGDHCSGAGLRTWAREVVPPMLARRQAEGRKDELVGRTLSIDGAQAVRLERLDERAIAASASPMRAETFNDLAPPAAVRRFEREGPRDPVSPDLPTSPLTPEQQRAAATIDLGPDDADDLELSGPIAQATGPQRVRRAQSGGSLRAVVLILAAGGLGLMVGLVLFTFVLVVGIVVLT